MKQSKKVLTRREKIDLLNSIRKGNITPDSLQEPILYLVIGGLELDGKFTVSEQRKNPRPTLYLSSEEFEVWKNSIEELNKKRKEPHKISIVLFTPYE